jgi:hypothetical protein
MSEQTNDLEREEIPAGAIQITGHDGRIGWGMPYVDPTATKTPSAAADVLHEQPTRADVQAYNRAVRPTCRGVRSDEGTQLVAEAFANGDRDAAIAHDAAHRRTCGQDLTEAILAAPMDGEDHTLACPKCGMPFTIRHPNVAE